MVYAFVWENWFHIAMSLLPYICGLDGDRIYYFTLNIGKFWSMIP